MSAAAVQIFANRAVTEEGVKLFPYDDKTGKSVAAPVGKLSWGIGFNLMTCGSVALFKVMLAFLATALDEALNKDAFYAAAGDVRQSVFLDIAYNEGLNGLVNGFPHMIKYAVAGDWTNASAECKVLDASLDKSRYEPLRNILLTGTAT
jgi:hypothetical protein